MAVCVAQCSEGNTRTPPLHSGLCCGHLCGDSTVEDDRFYLVSQGECVPKEKAK